jgi:hypothetical protein
MMKPASYLLALLTVVMVALGWPQPPAKRRYINLPNRPVQAPFSDGVLLGNTLYPAFPF